MCEKREGGIKKGECYVTGKRKVIIQMITLSSRHSLILISARMILHCSTLVLSSDWVKNTSLMTLVGNNIDFNLCKGSIIVVSFSLINWLDNIIFLNN